MQSKKSFNSHEISKKSLVSDQFEDFQKKSFNFFQGFEIFDLQSCPKMWQQIFNDSFLQVGSFK